MRGRGETGAEEPIETGQEPLHLVSNKTKYGIVHA